MPTPQPKTIAEHTQSIYDFTRLQLWFVRTWHSTHNDEPIATILRTRADIYRKTDLYPGRWRNDRTPRNYNDPRWLDIENAITQIHQRTRDNADSAEFEEAAFAVLKPSLDARIPRDFADGPAMEGFQCGSLKCDPPKPEHPRRVAFHIANALEPASCFADPRHLPECLLDLIRYAREHHNAQELTTNTWMNQLPRWLELFPQSWRDHMSPPNPSIDGGLGHWGQFYNARGLFNKKLGDQFRQTGHMPYLPCASWCTFDDLERHMQLNT